MSTTWPCCLSRKNAVSQVRGLSCKSEKKLHYIVLRVWRSVTCNVRFHFVKKFNFTYKVGIIEDKWSLMENAIDEWHDQIIILYAHWQILSQAIFQWLRIWTQIDRISTSTIDQIQRSNSFS